MTSLGIAKTNATTDAIERRVRVCFDGGCRNNPNGIAAGGAVIYDADGAVIKHAGLFLERGSNNDAEWTGLIIGLEAAQALGATHVDVWGDSELVVRQYTGVYGIKEPRLQKYCDRARAIANEFAGFAITHHKREHNGDADSICTALLNACYVPDAPTLAEAIGKKPVAAVPAALAEISVTFTCAVTMDPAAVKAGRAAGISDSKLTERLAADAERRLTMAGALGSMSVVPKRVGRASR